MGSIAPHLANEAESDDKVSHKEQEEHGRQTNIELSVDDAQVHRTCDAVRLVVDQLVFLAVPLVILSGMVDAC
jgi:hypothetical protein